MADSKTNASLDGEIDSLFQLPLSNFTAARNALAARLKKAGNELAAEQVKTLPKPSISAWAVNQLWWKHRHAFLQLTEAAAHLAQAHAAQLSGKASDVQASTSAKRAAVSALLRLASELLREGGHNPGQETLRRIGITLEALCAHASSEAMPNPGRLTEDVDPPGFESLAALFSDSAAVRPHTPAAPTGMPAPPAAKPKGREEKRQQRLDAARAALRNAERDLDEIRAVGRAVAAKLEEATAAENHAEDQRREAEHQYEKARAAANEARENVVRIRAEAERIAKALQSGLRNVENAREELRSQTGSSEG